MNTNNQTQEKTLAELARERQEMMRWWREQDYWNRQSEMSDREFRRQERGE